MVQPPPLEKLSIVIPAFNEERHIRPMTERLAATVFPVPFEIVIVDDASSDQTYPLACSLRDTIGGGRITVVRHSANRGRGACIRTALEHITGQWLVIQDADLEYSPQDLPGMVQCALQGKADVIYGSRFLGVGWPKGMALANYLANKNLVAVANKLYGLALTDVMGCYKLVPVALLKSLGPLSDGFEFDAELTAKLAHKGSTIMEFPIRYCARSRKEGKKIRPRDFWNSRNRLIALHRKPRTS